jgi:hypothetical protein
VETGSCLRGNIEELGMLSMKIWSIFLLLAILSGAINLQSSVPAPQLVLTVSMNVQRGEKEGTMSVTVIGKVMDPFNRTVQGATVSSQITDPSKSSLHISLVFSKGDGSYRDEFVIAKPVSGNYTLHLTASKPGFDDRTLHVPFTLVSGAFAVKISPNSRTLVQGSNTSFEIAVVPLQGSISAPLSIRIIGLPQRVSYNLLNKSSTSSETFVLTLITQEDTPVGTYNFTVIGEGKDYSQATWGILDVTETARPTMEPIYIPVVGETQIPSWTYPLFVILVGAVTSAFLFRKFKRGATSNVESKEPKMEPAQDREYLSIARALARLEELRASEKLDEDTYRKLRREYEEKLERARRKD